MLGVSGVPPDAQYFNIPLSGWRPGSRANVAQPSRVTGRRGPRRKKVPPENPRRLAGPGSGRGRGCAEAPLANRSGEMEKNGPGHPKISGSPSRHPLPGPSWDGGCDCPPLFRLETVGAFRVAGRAREKKKRVVVPFFFVFFLVCGFCWFFFLFYFLVAFFPCGASCGA
ncbi:uncharacterized protein TM35_000173230 [Trypanosoma theileri]|uniref:Uncharacterized protein n=1 Tax=Trypanosoma theileri TaxID=67003 RepID=A0A1X0NV14_9TRYP|nr:uncharacterized protein TM35_000173230 [Trypanosoma theileri]ORC88451.1 hypothetical protein TM35_000173230 [Trypanosoma theileri]